MYLLDTNVVSALRRANPSDSRYLKIRAWVDGIAATDLFLSVITVLEIEIGILRVRRRDAAQGTALRAWLDRQVLPAFVDRILPVDLAVAQMVAQLHVPDPRPERDALIAATALVHRLAVVTRNVADFRPMGVPLLNPWD